MSLSHVADLITRVAALEYERNTYLAELVELRERYEQVRLELQELRAEGVLLPGWACTGCWTFNGAAREQLTHCRACGRERA